MSTFADKDHVPEASKLLKELLSSHWKSLGIKIDKHDVNFRYLVSKFCFSEDHFTEEDKVALFTSYESMVNKCAIDKDFAHKHQWWLFITRSLAQSLNGTIKPEIRREFSKQIQQFTSYGRGYFAGSIYFGIKVRGERLYEIWIKTRFSKTTKTKSRIAVGYRDKGHLQMSHEGSQHWSEIAMALYDPKSESTSEKQERLWRNLIVHKMQILNS